MFDPYARTIETINLIAHSKKELILMFQAAIHVNYYTEISLNNSTKTHYTIVPLSDEKIMKKIISNIKKIEETEFEFL